MYMLMYELYGKRACVCVRARREAGAKSKLAK